MSSTKPQTLPERPDLDHLKKQARDLLNLARENDASALERLAHVARERAASPATVKLSDAQHALARSYGFSSWSELRHEVKRRRTALIESEGLPDDPEQRLDLVYQAIEQNDAARLKLLVRLDASLAHGWGERRPISHAVQFDRAELVEILVGAGVSPAADYGFPHDSLSWAITVGGLGAARRLLELGAPLDLWCSAGLGDVTRLSRFFDEQGPIAGASRHGVTRFDEAGRMLPKPPTEPREIVSDALYIAARNGQLEAARFLLDRGADPNFVGFNRAPVLHWAAYSGNQALLRLLLERGADPHAVDGAYRATYRVFAVRIAIEWSVHKVLLRVLSGDPALSRERDVAWGPPLHAAAAQGLDDHVQTLLEYGADPLEVDASGRSALDCARAAADAAARARVLSMLEALAFEK